MARQLAAKGLTVAMALSGVGVVANVWVLLRPRARLYHATTRVPSRPVAIVPGTRVRPDGTPSTALAHRLAAALDLHHADRVGRILLSGDGREVPVMRAWVLARGVPDSALLLDDGGHRTRATMERAARRFGVEGAVICTQAFHLARAVLLACRAGIDAVGLVADRDGYRPDPATRLREYVARQMAFVESYVTG